MPRELRVALAGMAVFALTAGCGTTIIDRGGSSSGAAGPSGAGSSVGGGAPHPDCASAEGIRLCGGTKQCPALEPPQCLGTGCTPALDRDSYAPSNSGVCWADVKEAAALQCVACRDGEVCVQRYPDQLVCVPEGVCRALWDLGARTVCRYADRSHYDGRPLLRPTGCPAAVTGDPWELCGGDCPACKMAALCVGRSPEHPFGFCMPVDMKGDPAYAQPCAQDGYSCSTGVCAFYVVPEIDKSAARHNGICLAPQSCVALRAVMPGGLHCIDKYGTEL